MSQNLEQEMERTVLQLKIRRILSAIDIPDDEVVRVMSRLDTAKIGILRDILTAREVALAEASAMEALRTA